MRGCRDHQGSGDGAQPSPTPGWGYPRGGLPPQGGLPPTRAKTMAAIVHCADGPPAAGPQACCGGLGGTVSIPTLLPI